MKRMNRRLVSKAFPSKLNEKGKTRMKKGSDRAAFHAGLHHAAIFKMDFFKSKRKRNEETEDSKVI